MIKSFFLKITAISILLSLCSTSVYGLSAPSQSYCNIALGKFYTFNITPHATYSDIWANEWTDGAKLTDEEFGQSWPMDKWVGWTKENPYQLEITVDLGKNRVLQQIKAHFASRTGWGIYYPQQVTIYTKTSQAGSFSLFEQITQTPADTSGYSTAWITSQQPATAARYVKFEIQSGGHFIFIDEIELYGNITNTWKNVPDYGAYFGAYPSDSDGYMNIGNFESIIEKQISMVLWYAEMGTCDFTNYLGSLWTSQYGFKYSLDYQGSRYLEVGWEPELTITAEDVASGYYDSYFKQFFEESIDYQNRGGNTDPVWFRPMSEMNGGWTFGPDGPAWGGDPLNFRRAWRRMVNIAQQVGAADKHIFLWAPNGISYPDDAWNQPVEYYPGDQYVDWVGLSLYPQGDNPYPSSIIQPFYSQFSYKPMMISEGSLIEKDGLDKVQWVNDWFDMQYNFPMIKAIVWFHTPSNHDISKFTQAYNTYKQRVSDSYFLRQSIAGIFDFNNDYSLDYIDLSESMSNWIIQQSNLKGDINGDNSVDFRDFGIISDYWKK
jgi:hypothetical protein